MTKKSKPENEIGAQRLRQALAARNMTQRELAQLIHMTPQGVHHICSGKNNLRHAAAEIAAALHVRESYLLGYCDIMDNEDEMRQLPLRLIDEERRHSLPTEIALLCLTTFCGAAVKPCCEMLEIMNHCPDAVEALVITDGNGGTHVCMPSDLNEFTARFAATVGALGQNFISELSIKNRPETWNQQRSENETREKLLYGDDVRV